MFSALKLCRNVAVITSRTPRTFTLNVFRQTSLRNHSIKVKGYKNKEPGEVIKWVLLMIPVTSFGLGCWQVYRLQWKLELIDILHAKTNANPIDMPQDFKELETMEYRPVKVHGEFLHDKEILIGPRAFIENQSALPSEVILVNRGWIPQGLRPKEKRQESMVKGDVELTGVVRLTESRSQFMPKNIPEKGTWFYRDLDQMSSYLGCSPVWLDARGIPDPPEGWPIPNQTRVTLRNEHLSYLTTWFLLSGFTGLMWHRYFIRKLPLL
ncbi:surfeit locus protein 1 isoform X2 [Epargyreus clarus]|uniref:surfeit locus protein 1 isoform X2 n=1 Tax=Epargyreus clarus TaxID=520877 RepID=UPI003C2F6A71